jgi:hypothetical protein
MHTHHNGGTAIHVYVSIHDYDPGRLIVTDGVKYLIDTAGDRRSALERVRAAIDAELGTDQPADDALRHLAAICRVATDRPLYPHDLANAINAALDRARTDHH